MINLSLEQKLKDGNELFVDFIKSVKWLNNVLICTRETNYIAFEKFYRKENELFLNALIFSTKWNEKDWKFAFTIITWNISGKAWNFNSLKLFK